MPGFKIMNNSSYENYHHYQKKISFSGNIYRKYYLYPRIRFHLLPGTLLDIGCGLGDFIALGNTKNNFGVEVNPLNVQYAKNRGLNVSLIEPSGLLPFEDSTFNNIVLDNVLEHIHDPTILLNEIKRVLKPGGRVIVGVPGEKGFAYDDDHKMFYDQSSLTSVMTKHGFKFFKIFFTPLPVMSWSKTMRQFCLYGVFNKN